jgi:hypothetical protein
MPELGMSGSVRGALRNERPYRERRTPSTIGAQIDTGQPTNPNLSATFSANQLESGFEGKSTAGLWNLRGTDLSKGKLDALRRRSRRRFATSRPIRTSCEAPAP